MTATEELRALLDARGVEWTAHDNAWVNETYWKDANEKPTWASERVVPVGNIAPSGLVQKRHTTPAQAVEATLGPKVTGETSDGYHTFNELYHHRAVLFSVIVRDHPELAWKSRLHHDGTMYDGMFIVGVETTQGQATYHYDVDPYWEMFDCRELDRAPEWDGHTPDDAIARIATLGRGECIMAHEDGNDTWWSCNACDADVYLPTRPNYCWNCGAKVVEG